MTDLRDAVRFNVEVADDDVVAAFLKEDQFIMIYPRENTEGYGAVLDIVGGDSAPGMDREAIRHMLATIGGVLKYANEGEEEGSYIALPEEDCE